MKPFIHVVLAVVCGLGIGVQPASAASGRIEYTEYKQYEGTLPPEYRDKMAPLVEDVVKNVKAGGSAKVRIQGHADFDAQGDDFVTKVSYKRAVAAQQALMSQIMVRADLEGVPRDQLMAKLNVAVEGMGTKKALYAQDRPMSERVRNRRVEIAWEAVSPVPPPAPKPPPPPPSPETVLKVVGGGIWNGSSTVRLPGEWEVRFTVTNSNPLLGTTITIECEFPCVGQKKSRIVPPLGTVELDFQMAGKKPREWVFHAGSDSDSFVVTWKAMSHVPK